MNGKDAVTTFINTLLTESEKITIGRRILIAQMILAGKNQSEIIYKLGVSPNTFTRTRKWLDGQVPDYDQALKNFEKEAVAKKTKIVKQNRSRIYTGSTSFASLRRKYPAHFLIFNIAEEILAKFSK